jgi:2,3-bisphosphoglycerate-independent phosphoglycerate mutase
MEGLYKIIENQRILSKKEETALDKANELMLVWRGIMPDLRAL